MERIGNIDIRQLVHEFGTPLYVYDIERLIENYTNLVNTFSKYYQKTKIHFSVKANSNIHILRQLSAAGAGADCSSPIEFILAGKSGFSPDRIVYTGNYESLEDFSVVINPNQKLNLDDISSFRRLVKYQKPDLVSFRINPGIGRGGFEGITTGGTDAKFGVPYEKSEDAYKLAISAGVKRFGIHMMTGSNNLEPYYFAEVVEKLMMIAGRMFNKLGITPEFVDIGGGLGVPYNDLEEPLNIDLMAKLVSEVFIEKCKKYGFGEPELILEPGRYIAADAGYLLAKVTSIKHSYKTFVGVDAGMNTLLRPALYGAVHRTSIYGKEGREITANICGQICENSDIFTHNAFLPNVEEGDIMIFKDAGAYGYVMASNYNNRLRPAEIMVLNDEYKLIRRRETIEDILNLFPNN